MTYKIQYASEGMGDGKALEITWNEAKQGYLSVPIYFRKGMYKSVIMTKAEADTFQEMENMGLTKNIEPGKTFFIKYAWD